MWIALFDRLDKTLQETENLAERAWNRREIENYLCSPEVLLAWAEGEAQRESLGGLFADPLVQEWRQAMDKVIEEVARAMDTLGRGSPWSPDAKVSDDFLTPLFAAFYRALKLPNLMEKTDFHRLARYLEPTAIDPEVVDILNSIATVADRARPTGADV